MMIGFLLGAGFSKALHEDMPVMAELMQELNSAIPESVPREVRTDLERTLSYLWTGHPWHTQQENLRNRAAYLDLVTDIHRVLAETEFVAWRQLSHELDALKTWQGRLGKMLSMSNCSIVLTMNYDTLLERFMFAVRGQKQLVYPAPLQRLYAAWDQEGERYSDGDSRGFVFGRVEPKLYKLHGSLSWYAVDLLDPNSIVYGVDLDRYYNLPSMPLPPNYDEALFPVIVPPVADKSPMYSNKVIRSQWIGAANGLKNCDDLYCIGYSFPKTDLAMQLFLSEACDKVSRIHIVNRHVDPEMESRVRDIFGPSKEIDVNYVGDNCVEQMTEYLWKTGTFKETLFVNYEDD